jgi:integrase
MARGSKPEWYTRWASTPRRWNESALMALPIGARVFEHGVFAKRTTTGITWGIYYRAPVVDGSRRTKNVLETLPHCTNKTQAEGVLVTRKGEVFQGTFRPARRERETTLAGWLPDFVKLRSHRKTIGKYEKQITRVFLPMWGSKPLRALTRADVQAWYVKRLERGAVATANRELAALRACFSEAIANDKCEVNPCKGVKTRAEHNMRDRVLSDREAHALAEAAEKVGGPIPALFALLYYTGGRLSEVLELEWAAIDDERGVVRLRDAKDGRPRSVPMHAGLAAVLRSWRQRNASRWVFPGGDGKHLTIARKRWLRMCALAGVTVTAHELRHNFVSQLQAAGVADTIIMDMTGHRTLAMLKRYSHSRDAHRAKAITQLPALGSHLTIK